MYCKNNFYKAKDIDFSMDIRNLRDNDKRTAFHRKKEPFIEGNQSILDKVRGQMLINWNDNVKVNNYDPGSLLNGIPKEDIYNALMVRANGILDSFTIATGELEKIELILKEKIVDCRGGGKEYSSPEDLERAKNLAFRAADCRYLLSRILLISETFKTKNPISISAAILSSGHMRRKLEALLTELKSIGIDAKKLSVASNQMEKALDGVNDYQLQLEKVE